MCNYNMQLVKSINQVLPVPIWWDNPTLKDLVVFTIVCNPIHIDLNTMHAKIKMMKNPFSKIGSFIFGNCYQLERKHCQQKGCNYINTNRWSIIMVKSDLRKI